MFLLITTCQLLSELNKERRAVDDTALGLDWEAFRASKPSKSAVQGLKPEHLVSPAGSLGSELCFVLHYPTFQTKHSNNGEVFDTSNRSITRLAGSGFNADNTLFGLTLFVAEEIQQPRVASAFSRASTLNPLFLITILNG